MKCEELLKGLTFECIRGSIDREIKEGVFLSASAVTMRTDMILRRRRRQKARRRW